MSSSSSMLPSLCEDLLVEIASHVDDRKDLASFALTSRVCRAPAHKCLFMVITLHVRVSGLWLADFMSIFSDNPTLCSYVRTLDFTGPGCSPAPRLTLHLVCAVLDRLPVVRTLSLRHVRWAQSVISVSQLPKYPQLDTLRIQDVISFSTRASIFDTLFAQEVWKRVMIWNVTHFPALTTVHNPNPTPLVTAHRLSLKQDMFQADVGTMSCPVREVVTLRIEYVDEQYPPLLCHILRQSLDTIQYVYFNLNPLNACGPTDLWVNVVAALGQCHRLVTFVAFVPLYNERGSPNTHIGYHAMVLQAMLARLPTSVRYINIVMEIGYSVRDNASFTLRLLDWETIAQHLFALHNLALLQLTIESFREPVRWSMVDLIKLVTKFPRLPRVQTYREMRTARLSSLRYTPEQLDTLATYRPDKPGDIPPI
ncbi:hypothetical protein EIP86_006393 [Pleurotus ostreatoroseus]|nr:hypothetical protein EIP86_006393 [Pleurotus ostreatoroseus]